MSKFLIPVDGSVHMAVVFRYLSSEFLKNTNITRFLSQNNKLTWFKEQASLAYGLSSCHLESAGIPFQINYPNGVHVHDISKIAKSLDCSQIVVCRPAHGSFVHLFEKTSTHELIGQGDMPVVVVPREYKSLFER